VQGVGELGSLRQGWQRRRVPLADPDERDHYRSVVELVDVAGMPYRDAATALDVPLGTVMSRLHRARRILRELLGGYARSFGYGAGTDAAFAAA
jgi:DNA-directed RNA polymerase specialized sigma24 family protein